MHVFGIEIYWRDRLFEWIMAFIMILLAMHLAVWPGSIQASSFRYVLQVVPATYICSFFTVFGFLRMAALVANGYWPKYGMRFRVIGAAAAALMWGQMSVALFILAPLNNGIPSPGIPVYFALVIGELVSIYRAVSDARPTNR